MSVLHIEVVALVDAYRALINGDVVHGQANALALLRNPYRTIVVACPSRDGVERIEVAHILVGVQANTCHEVLACAERLGGLLGERQVAVLVEACQVFH